MTARQIPESDWRTWRRLSQVALERYCARVLADAARYAQGPDSAHQRYVALYRYLERCDEVIALVFNDLRRSNAYLSIANATRQGLVSSEEVRTLSPDTQAVVKAILG
jgi:hypothetical protein